MKLISKERYIDSRGKLWLIFKTDVGDMYGDYIEYYGGTFFLKSANYYTDVDDFPDTKKFAKTKVSNDGCKIHLHIPLDPKKDFWCYIYVRGDYKIRQDVKDMETDWKNLVPEIYLFFIDNLQDLIDSEKNFNIAKLAEEANLKISIEEEKYQNKCDHLRNLGILK